MSNEEFGKPLTIKTETGPVEEVGIGEEVALEELLKIVEQIKARLEENPEHDVNDHWEAAVLRLRIAMGREDVIKVLESQGWNENTFPNN